MIKQNWKTYAAWIFLAEAVGTLSGWLSREGMQYFQAYVAKPPFSPPPILFPIAWGILYLLMGIGAARVSLSADCSHRKQGLNLFVIQLTVNFLWTPLFFLRRSYGLAFLWLLLLWILVLLMILRFRKCDRLAALLQVPYLLWLTFAAYLNFGVWQLN